MKRLILIATLLTGFQIEAGPILVGQGTGQSEYSLIFARANLPELFRSCGSVCALSTEQRALLKNLGERGAKPPAAVFKTRVDLGEQVFRLENNGSEVWFNQDVLWLDGARTIPYSIPFATIVWVDVLVSQMPLAVSEADLEQVRTELVLLLSQRMIRIPGTMAGVQVLEALVWKSDVQDKFFIRNAEFENYDFTQAIQDSLACPIAARLNQLRISTVRWTLLTRESDEGRLRIRLDTMLNWRCGEEGRRGRAMIVMMAEPLPSGAFRIQPDTTQVFEQGE